MSEPEPVRRGWRHALAFERVLALIFVMLGVVLSLLIAVYWFAVLEPTLRADAESHSRVLAQAQAHKIEGLLGGDLPARRLLDELNTVLDEILLVKDQSNGEPLTPRIELMLDPDLISLPPESLSLNHGLAECPRCLVTQVPLYHPRERVLIGIATFHANAHSLQELIENARGNLLWGGGAILALIGASWLGISRLLRRLGESEASLQSLLEVSPFPMLLVEEDQQGISLANQAAKRYLDLVADASGQLQSPAWQRLHAAGLTRLDGQHEAQIVTGDGAIHWAMVSALRVRLAGRLKRLVSLVDISELKAIQQRLYQVAITDGLTGLYNRRHLMSRLAEEIERSERHGYPLSIILFDLDAFKSINDTYGHGVGDEVLVRTAELLRRCTRQSDVCGRHGGEELLVILPHAGLAIATEIAERIRVSIKALEWTNPGLRVTISGGVCEHVFEDLDHLLEAADRCLYQAKQSGRDRIIARVG